MRTLLLLTLIVANVLSSPAQPFEGFDDIVVFPDDAGVIDLTQAPYLAKGDGTTDNTEAIQRAFDENPSGNKIFYLPEGVYLVSNTIQWKGTGGAEKKRNILQGQNTRNTIIRLIDNAAGYQNPDERKAVINTGFKPAQRFRNAIRNLTLSTGSGNPGAAGIQFIANNQGGMYSVIIRSEDGAGTIGLDMKYTDEVGPLLIKELFVEGFDIGIKTEFQTASQTFEDVHLKNQNVYGWHNTGTQTVFARRFTSENTVPAILNNREGRFLLVNATLSNPSEAGGDAIINQKSFYARDVATPGYDVAITNNLLDFRGNNALSGEYIAEYWANGAYENRRGGPFELFASPDQMLNLPVKETPRVPWETDLSQWVSPLEFGGQPDDDIDDTEAIQRAIDAGKTTVYLPNNVWQIDGELVLRGNVERIIGTEALLKGTGSIRVADGTSPNIRIERVEIQSNLRLIHDTPRTLTLAAIHGPVGVGLNYQSTEAAGDLFLEDISIEAFTIRAQQRLWARQLNIETNTEATNTAKLTNDGGTVWILGYKTEMGGTTIKTINGGTTELLGALHVSSTGNAPRFITEDASFSAATVHTAPAGTEFPTVAVEQRDGVRRTASTFNQSNSYTAFSAQAIADSIRYVDNADSSQTVVTGEWASSTSFPGGFLESDFRYANPGSSSSFTFASPLPAPGRYEVFLRWVNDSGGQGHSGHATNAPVTVQYQEADTLLRVDQTMNGGQWNSLGTYPFDEEGIVTLSTQGADNKVIADGVRFVRVSADTVVAPSPQTTITIHAAGRTNEETMSLRVDGQTVKQWNSIAGNASERNFVTYRYESEEVISIAQLQVAFTNDNGGNRDVRIDKITVNGTTYQTEAADTYSTGTWRSNDGCGAGFKQSEWLHCAGYFAFVSPEDSAWAAGSADETKIPSASSSVLQLYPNPTTDQVLIRLPRTMQSTPSVHLRVLTLGGQVVHHRWLSKQKDAILSTRAFGRGTYLVEVAAGNRHATQRLIVR